MNDENATKVCKSHRYTDAGSNADIFSILVFHTSLPVGELLYATWRGISYDLNFVSFCTH